MTITDETDEDAASLNDDALLEAYLEAAAPPGAGPDLQGTGDMPDWPTITMRNVGLAVDTETLYWFRTNHADWRREMGFILRAWVVAQADGATAVLPAVD